MFKKLCALALVFAGCAAPQNKSASLEYLRDSRDFSTLSVYGGAEVAPQTKLFGNVDLNSPFNRADTADLTRFNGRIRLVRPVWSGFGATTEYKDFVGDNNNVGAVGVSYTTNGVELRAHPLRTDGSREAGVSFGRVFKTGKISPYLRGFTDVGRSDGEFYTVGEVQIGVRTESGWRVAAEFRYSDPDRRKGFENPGVAVGLGIDF